MEVFWGLCFVLVFRCFYCFAAVVLLSWQILIHKNTRSKLNLVHTSCSHSIHNIRASFFFLCHNDDCSWNGTNLFITAPPAEDRDDASAVWCSKAFFFSKRELSVANQMSPSFSDSHMRVDWFNAFTMSHLLSLQWPITSNSCLLCSSCFNTNWNYILNFICLALN